jgi:site-specific recombinase XerD
MNDTLTMMLKSGKVNAAEGEGGFCNRHGQPHCAFLTVFERAVRQAGIQDFTVHDLRHTFARRLVMAGVDLSTMKESLAHKEIAMTRCDVHLSSDHKQTAVKKLDKSPSKIHNAPMLTQQVSHGNR